MEFAAIIVAGISGAVALGAAIVSACTCVRYKNENSTENQKATTVDIENEATTEVTKVDGSSKKTTRKQKVHIDNMKMDHASQLTNISIPVENQAANIAAGGGAAGLGAAANMLNPASLLNNLPSSGGQVEAEVEQSKHSAFINGATNMFEQYHQTKRAALQNAGPNSVGNQNETEIEVEIPATPGIYSINGQPYYSTGEDLFLVLEQRNDSLLVQDRYDRQFLLEFEENDQATPERPDNHEVAISLEGYEEIADAHDGRQSPPPKEKEEESEEEVVVIISEDEDDGGDHNTQEPNEVKIIGDE